MKKLLLIGAILISCFCCINAKATLNYTKAEDVALAFRVWNSDYYFTENEHVNPITVMFYTIFTYGYLFEDYAEFNMSTSPETGEQWIRDAIFTIPAEVYEDNIKKLFNIDDEFIKNEMRFTCEGVMIEEYSYKEIDGEYYYQYKVFYGIGGGIEWIEFIGYKDLGNNYYELYTYELNYGYDELDPETGEYEWFPYTPETNDIEGIDYIIDEYGKYAEILYVIKLKVQENGEYIKHLSYEKIEKENFVKDSNLIVVSTPAITVAKEDISIKAEEDLFPENTEITIEKQTSGSIYDVASKALQEKASAFIVFEINAKSGDYDVEPNGKVTITISVPEGYKNPVIYYVSEDGKLEKIETKVENGIASAEVTHFSTYALVDEKVTVTDKVEDTVDKEETVIDKVVESVVENPGTGIISGVGIVAVAGGCGAYFYNKSKKKNKFPQA